MTYGSMTSRKKPPLDWIYDFNKIREIFYDKYNDSDIESDMSWFSKHTTFEIEGGNYKEFKIL